MSVEFFLFYARKFISNKRYDFQLVFLDCQTNSIRKCSFTSSVSVIQIVLHFIWFQSPWFFFSNKCRQMPRWMCFYHSENLCISCSNVSNCFHFSYFRFIVILCMCACLGVCVCAEFKLFPCSEAKTIKAVMSKFNDWDIIYFIWLYAIYMWNILNLRFNRMRKRERERERNFRDDKWRHT